MLTPGLAAWLRSPPEESSNYRSPADLDAVLDSWRQRGVRIVELGVSKNGHPIRAAVLDNELGADAADTRTLLAWGYPHPDEPLGAEALCWLGESILTGRLSDLIGWRLVLVLCADPDEGGRQKWLHWSGDAASFVSGVWRPTKLDWMVDYGFPLDWGPFWQPADYEGACRTKQECRHRCGLGTNECLYAGRAHAPLPESLALAQAIDRFRPDVVAAMHSTHTGGDYTFLLEREEREVLEDLVALPGEFGLARHLGEPLDRGRRWMRNAPDLIQEPDLADFRRELERLPWFDPELVYQRNHSAGAYIQAQGYGAQFICPESTLFRDPAFGVRSPLEETGLALVSTEERRRGRYEMTRTRNQGEWVVAHQLRTDKRLAPPRESALPLTRGMLGVIALTQRRQALASADALWAKVSALPGLAYHPYAEERSLLKVPGRYVHDRSMLIFRTREDYRHPATTAQAATFRWVWPLHTAALLGNFANWLQAQDLARPEIMAVTHELTRIQSTQLAAVSDRVLQAGPRGPAMASMLARVFRVMLAKSS